MRPDDVVSVQAYLGGKLVTNRYFRNSRYLVAGYVRHLERLGFTATITEVSS